MIRLTRTVLQSWSARSGPTQIYRTFSGATTSLKTGNSTETVIPEGTAETKVTRRAKKRQSLTPFQRYCVDGGIERPYTGELWYEKAPGTYNCVQCESELFR